MVHSRNGRVFAAWAYKQKGKCPQSASLQRRIETNAATLVGFA
jgi:hypothetical protein